MMLVCDAADCPLATDGRCLEGFEEPNECPHTHEADENDGLKAKEPVQNDTGESATAADEIVDIVESKENPAVLDLGGNESLSISGAEGVAARYGARVVLVSGAYFSGKTCLVAGIYGLFHDGSAADWSFMGSTSLVALDARYHAKRAITGLEGPDSQRTRDEDMRLLDLRIAGPDGGVNLMFSDVRGEYFEDIVNGRPVNEVISLAARTDLLIIVLDGSRLADRFGRNSVVSFARQLIGGLTEPGGIRGGVPVALVVTKADKVDKAARAWLDDQLEGLAEFASQRELGTADRFVVAAFPGPDHPEPVGMVSLLEWLLADRSPAPRVPIGDDPQGTRSFLRGAVGD